jgi:hypothetical protein
MRKKDEKKKDVLYPKILCCPKLHETPQDYAGRKKKKCFT